MTRAGQVEALARALDAVAAADDVEARRAALEGLATRARAALRELGQAPAAAGPREALRGLFVGRKAELGRLAAQIERLALADQPLLVEGEPGTGKTLVALLLHDARAARGPLVRVVAPGPPDALARAGTERAATLLVEEPGLLPLPAQEELVRALAPQRGRRAPPRLVATSRLDLEALTARGWVVPALAEALAALRLRLPPLRETPGAAAEFLLAALRRRSAPHDPPAVTPAALEAAGARPWPTNARGVEDAAALLCAWRPRGPIDADDVARLAVLDDPRLALGPAPPRPARPPRSERAHGPDLAEEEPTLEALERRAIASRLERHGWQQVETARSLGIDRKTLYRKIRGYGLAPAAAPPGERPGPPRAR